MPRTGHRLATVWLLCMLCSCECVFGPNDAGLTQIWQNGAVLASGPPGVDAHSVYVYGGDRRLYALHRETGAVRWSVPLPGTNGTSDIRVVGDVVVAAVGTLLGLDAATGATRWSSNASENFGSLPFSVTDSVIYPSSYRGSGAIVAINVATGTERWRSNVVPPDTVVTLADQVRVLDPQPAGGSLVASFVLWKGPRVGHEVAWRSWSVRRGVESVRSCCPSGLRIFRRTHPSRLS